ncbi:Sex-regulated protein janus-A [Aphelenchoides fujianensis]|nr:Sex-regulated protein janus-A [Aphelenchoides fujianensis]
MLLFTARSICGVRSPNFSSVLYRTASSKMSGIDAIEDVDIDSKGKFKYILIEAKDSNKSKFIVRGYGSCGFHADIFDKVEGKAPKGIRLNCVGGGRILHEPDAKKINVYGYSQGFGQADHAKSVEILRSKYPNYDITFSNEGY